MIVALKGRESRRAARVPASARIPPVLASLRAGGSPRSGRPLRPAALPARAFGRRHRPRRCG